MKTINISLLVLVAVVLCSCKKKENADSSNTTFMKAVVDGIAITCDATSGAYNKKDKILSFYGRQADNKGGFDFNIFPFTGETGTYVLTTNNKSYVALYRTSDTVPENNIYSSVYGSGELVITSYENNVVTGTFKMVLVNEKGVKKTISNGEFKAKVPEF